MYNKEKEFCSTEIRTCNKNYQCHSLIELVKLLALNHISRS